MSREIGVRQFSAPDGASTEFLPSLPRMLYIAYPARVWKTWSQQSAAGRGPRENFHEDQSSATRWLVKGRLSKSICV